MSDLLTDARREVTAWLETPEGKIAMAAAHAALKDAIALTEERDKARRIDWTKLEQQRFTI